MIDVQQAVSAAKEWAKKVLGEDYPQIEEIERDSYKGREVWDVTLSREKQESGPQVIILGFAEKRDYRRVLIDAASGEFVGVKIRELVSK